MKFISFVSLFSSLFFFSSCTTGYKSRSTASATTPEYQEKTMVNVISANRLTASGGSIELSLPTDNVAVALEHVKYPGSKAQGSTLTFTVRNHPAIAGQIMGHSEGETLSRLFAAIMSDVQQKGLRPQAQHILKGSQTKFASIHKLSADQRADEIKKVLIETREQLFVVYDDVHQKLRTH
jgi:hypothetical protein